MIARPKRLALVGAASASASLAFVDESILERPPFLTVQTLRRTEGEAGNRRRANRLPRGEGGGAPPVGLRSLRGATQGKARNAPPPRPGIGSRSTAPKVAPAELSLRNLLFVQLVVSKAAAAQLLQRCAPGHGGRRHFRPRSMKQNRLEGDRT